jgi:hypothetical protein
VIDLRQVAAMVQLLVQRDERRRFQRKIGAFRDPFQLLMNLRANLADGPGTCCGIPQKIVLRCGLLDERLVDFFVEELLDRVAMLLAIRAAALAGRTGNRFQRRDGALGGRIGASGVVELSGQARGDQARAGGALKELAARVWSVHGDLHGKEIGRPAQCTPDVDVRSRRDPNTARGRACWSRPQRRPTPRFA